MLDKKWNANKEIEDSQEEFKNYSLKTGQYSVVDVNDYTKEELLKDDSLVTKMMLLEKSKNTEEIVDKIDNKDKELLKNMIILIYKNKIGETKAKENSIEIAKKMLNAKMPIKSVMKFTGLSENQLKKLAK